MTGQVLSPVTPKEPLSGIDLLKQELSHNAIVEGVENFEKDDLKHALIEEKNILPDAETLQTEKQQTELLQVSRNFMNICSLGSNIWYSFIGYWGLRF